VAFRPPPAFVPADGAPVHSLRQRATCWQLGAGGAQYRSSADGDPTTGWRAIGAPRPALIGGGSDAGTAPSAGAIRTRLAAHPRFAPHRIRCAALG